MAVQVYRKKPSSSYRPKERVRSQQQFARRLFFLHRLAPFFLVGVGVFLLGSVIVPILMAQYGEQFDLQAGAKEEMADVIPAEYTHLSGFKHEDLLPTPKPTPVVIAQELDYSDLSNWFPDHTLPMIAPQEAKRYTLSIPKLEIVDAEVVLGGTNLEQHLIQYPGTNLPGELGSPVIFGHSVLRQFYNPALTNPRRYISIFSTIMTLKTGDVIKVKDDRTIYTYKVTTKTEVKPTDRYILDQELGSRQLKLVTCTPEGTTLRRGVVTAVLDENAE